MSYYYGVLVVMLAGFIGWQSLNKPACREGFVPVTGFGTGWYCAAGYKP